MHNLISMASTDQLAEFAVDICEMLETDSNLYERAKALLHKKVYGDHFSDDTLTMALKRMANDDGTTGSHWTVDETNAVASKMGYRLTKYNEFDWNYVMNMMYSDYSTIFGDDTEAYAKMAFKFLTDPDAPEGKAYKYFVAMR